MSGMYPNKRLRENFHCETCPEYGALPLIAQCGECNQNLFLNCPHDGFHDGARYICTDCAERLSNNFPICTFHGKLVTYYCLNCAKGLCMECVLRSNDHTGHNYGDLEKIYRQLRDHVTKKLDELSERFKSREEDRKRVARNLEMITANEQELVTEVAALAESAKCDIRDAVAERKEELTAQLAKPIKKTMDRRDFDAKVNSMSKTELIQKHVGIVKEISQQMPDPVGQAHELVECHNIRCSLIPRVIMQPLFVDNVHKRKSPMSFLMFDASGYPWSVTAFIQKKFSLQFFAKNKRQEKYPHKVIIELLHDDFMKTLNYSFIIQRSEQSLELVEMKFLKENGFISTDEHHMLMMRIGIRPSSLIVENYLHIDENNKYRHGVDEEVASLKDQVDQLKQRSCSYFFLTLALLVKDKDCVLSHPLVDSQGTEWCLRLRRNEKETRTKESKVAHLGVYIVQLCGPKRKCKFFATLFNNDSEKIIRMFGEEMFELDELSYGQHSFVDFKELTEEAGYVNDGKMRFEFGVTPIIGDPPVIPIPNDGTSADFLRWSHLFGTFD
ncbi:uncharacterized protein LOC134220336 [Armigeres subalbatus]|uniref:uncharacterized protein LOC134220336 n=1 Tax=Armigeres subalbatus TaxID=124917 RepID=UPI002ED51418